MPGTTWHQRLRSTSPSFRTRWAKAFNPATKPLVKTPSDGDFVMVFAHWEHLQRKKVSRPVLVHYLIFVSFPVVGVLNEHEFENIYDRSKQLTEFRITIL